MLEIGAAYGVATQVALKKGCYVIANDLDKRHLKILWQRTPARLKTHLKLLPGSFPNKIRMAPNSVGAVLACRVLHFLDGPTLEKGLKKIFGWLAPGGCFVMVAETPYLRNWLSFLPVYEKRCKKGSKWPGLIKQPWKYNKTTTQHDLPKLIHFMDVEVLKRALSKTGFEIKKLHYLSRKNFPKEIRLDGRESVGAVCIKPV